MSPVCKMGDNGLLTVDQKVKVVLFYVETKSVVATQSRFRAHFGTRWAPCKQTIYRLSLGTIFQPVRINSVPDVKCLCENKSVLCVQSMVWHFVPHPVCNTYIAWCSTIQRNNPKNLYKNWFPKCVISGYGRGLNMIFALLGRYAA